MFTTSPPYVSTSGGAITRNGGNCTIPHKIPKPHQRVPERVGHRHVDVTQDPGVEATRVAGRVAAANLEASRRRRQRMVVREVERPEPVGRRSCPRVRRLSATSAASITPWFSGVHVPVGTTSR